MDPLSLAGVPVDARHDLFVAAVRNHPLCCGEPISRRSRAAKTSGRFVAGLAWLQAAHWVLLVLSLATIAGAVAGSQGWSF